MRRIFCIILSMCLCLMVMPYNFVAFAEEQKDDNFYGSGTASDPFKIRNATELALLAELVNEELVDGSYAKYARAYYIQTADIDLKNKSWTPIGKFIGEKPHCFTGSYNGNYHTVKNLNCNRDNN